MTHSGAMMIRDLSAAAGRGGDDDVLSLTLRRAFMGDPGVRVLAGLGLPVAGGVERLGAVVVHAGGLVVVRSTAPGSVPCLTGRRASVEADPCRIVVDARRQAEAVRAHLSARAPSLLRRRLWAGRFAAALPVEALVVADRPACPDGDAVCRTLVLTPQAVETRVRALVERQPGRDVFGRRLRLRECEVAAIADHLSRVHVRPVNHRPPPEPAAVAVMPA